MLTVLVLLRSDLSSVGCAGRPGAATLWRLAPE